MKRSSWLVWLVAVTVPLAGIAGCTQKTLIPDSRDAGTPGIDAQPPEVDAAPMAMDAGVDAFSMCEVELIDCFGTCTRVAEDSRNCGSCGNVCPDGVTCAAGRCNCETPMLSCDGICIDPSADTSHCGACGNACEPAEECLSGECILVCDEPNRVCNQRGEDGETFRVCADNETDPLHCGTCGTRCGPGASCLMGRCQCTSGLCGGRCVDWTSDPENCGSCGIRCGTGGTCTDSRCTDCGTDRILCDGRCIDGSADPFNCGDCDRRCDAGESCSGGLCSCSGTLLDCGAGCLDPATTPSQCGGCGIDCGPGGVCTDSVCMCTGTRTLCSMGCRELSSDPLNCGACENACPVTGSICADGACACPAGTTECDGACRNLASDRSHCGACGAACPGDQVCSMSACTDVPPPPHDECSGAIALSDASGTRTMDTLLGASMQSLGDCGGEEVYYSITITSRSVLYLDTFGSGFDTRVAYRSTTCDGAAVSCVDDSCTGNESQIAVLAEAGTHFFSVHAAPGATAGPLSIRWQALPAAGGTNERVTMAGTRTGTTAGSTGIRNGSCSTAGGPENGYWFTLCPGTTRSVGANTCMGTSFDTVVHATGRTGGACNDDGCDLFDFQSSISFSAAGPGAWIIFVDGWGSSSSGPYQLAITGL